MPFAFIFSNNWGTGGRLDNFYLFFRCQREDGDGEVISPFLLAPREDVDGA